MQSKQQRKPHLWLPRFSDLPSLSSPYRYLIAVVITSIAFGARYTLQPVIGDHAPFILFPPFIMIAAWLGGIGPAIVVTVLSTLLTHYFFIHPTPGWGPIEWAHLLAAGTFIFSAAFVVILTRQMRLYADALEKQIEGGNRLRDELQCNEERFKRIYDSAAIGLVEVDASGKVLDCNRAFCEIIGYEIDEIRRKSVSEIVVEADRSSQETLFQRLVTGSLPVLHHQRRYVRKDGGIIWANVTATFLRDKRNHPVCALGIVEEITARIEAEAALRRAQQLMASHAEELERRVTERTAALRTSLKDMERFCYTIAHNLRAPLRAMVGFTAALVEDYGDAFDNEGKMYCDRIRGAATRMDAMISGLLEYGRLSHSALAIKPLNLAKEVEQAIEAFGAELQYPKAELVMEELPRQVCGNSLLLQQVLGNLLTNALKFVPPATLPRIRIFCRNSAQRVRLCVQDNGIGIEAAHAQKIFEPFQRLHGGNVYPGTGIGLSIAQKAVARMGGEIGVESVVNQGSCFWVELPTHQDCPCEEKLCVALSI